jgi:hypothetical protein
MDPFKQVITGDRVPTSSRTWNAILNTVRGASNTETPPISGPTQSNWRPPDFYIRHTGSTTNLARGQILPLPKFTNDYYIDIPVSTGVETNAQRPPNISKIVIDVDVPAVLNQVHSDCRSVMVMAQSIRPGQIGGVYISGLHWINISTTIEDANLTPARKKLKYLSPFYVNTGFPLFFGLAGFPILAKQRHEGTNNTVSYLVNIDQYISPVYRAMIYKQSSTTDIFVIDDDSFTIEQLTTMSLTDLRTNFVNGSHIFFADDWYDGYSSAFDRYRRFLNRTLIYITQRNDGKWVMMEERGRPISIVPIDKWLGYSTGGALLYGPCCSEEESISGPTSPVDPLPVPLETPEFEDDDPETPTELVPLDPPEDEEESSESEESSVSEESSQSEQSEESSVSEESEESETSESAVSEESEISGVSELEEPGKIPD